MVPRVIDVGHNMNLKAVCEGIEQEQEIAILRRYGCEIGQGYYYHRPAASEEIGRLLRAF